MLYSLLDVGARHRSWNLDSGNAPTKDSHLRGGISSWNVVVNPRRDVATDLPQVHEQRRCGLYVGLGDARAGSWQADGEETSINRYMIDFQAWEQRNLDNHHRRSVRLVWVTAESVDPKWNGQKPQ